MKEWLAFLFVFLSDFLINNKLFFVVLVALIETEICYFAEREWKKNFARRKKPNILETKKFGIPIK